MLLGRLQTPTPPFHEVCTSCTLCFHGSHCAFRVVGRIPGTCKRRKGRRKYEHVLSLTFLIHSCTIPFWTKETRRVAVRVAELAGCHRRLEFLTGEVCKAVHSECIGMTLFIVRVDQRHVRLRARPIEPNYALEGGGSCPSSTNRLVGIAVHMARLACVESGGPLPGTWLGAVRAPRADTTHRAASATRRILGPAAQATSSARSPRRARLGSRATNPPWTATASRAPRRSG